MKVYCKRTKFHQEGPDTFTSVKWEKDKWYEFIKPHGYESNYIYGYIKNTTLSESISKSDFDKYFYTQRELRDIRINKIIN